jgi:hypothetical protein
LVGCKRGLQRLAGGLAALGDLGDPGEWHAVAVLDEGLAEAGAGVALAAAVRANISRLAPRSSQPVPAASAMTCALLTLSAIGMTTTPTATPQLAAR